MNTNEIKKKAADFFTEYLNHTIDSICGKSTDDDSLEKFFPLEVLKNTSRFSDTIKDHSQEMVEIFLHSKNKTGLGYSLEMETVNTRSNGRKSIIKRVYFENENDYLEFINVKGRVENLKSALAVLSQDEVLPPPQLRNWAKKHVKDLTVQHGEGPSFWHSIAQCALRTDKNSESQPVHISSEFVNSNKKIIQSLWSDSENEIQISDESETVSQAPQEKKVLTEPQILQQPSVETVQEENHPEAKQKPFSIRFRSLSSENPIKLGRLSPKEIALPLDDFIHLNQTNFLKQISTILLVGSETIFQTFPASEKVLCIFAPDYAVNALKLCQWFAQYQLIYFGDISEHGFDVISAFRNTWSKAETMCMDGNTWEKFFMSADSGPHLKNNAIPKNLSDAEKNTFLSLRLTAGKSRLLQEKIPLSYMAQFLNAIKINADEVQDVSENDV